MSQDTQTALLRLRDALTPPAKQSEAAEGYENFPQLDDGSVAPDNSNRLPSGFANLRPAEAAALVLVLRAMDTYPEISEIRDTPAAAVVVEVPGSDWVSPIAEAFRILVLQSEDVPRDGDENEEPIRYGGRRKKEPETWYEFRRDGHTKTDRPETGNLIVGDCLSKGLTVLGYSQSPEKYLPRDLLRVADLRLTIPALDAWALELVVGVLTGGLPTTPISSEFVKTVSLDDLALARRPGQTPDDFVERLNRFSRVKNKSDSPVTLADLHGMDDAVAWGMSLAKDLFEYANGTLPWSAVDRGALVYGPPGTGKTTFAKALAASCAVPLVTGSLSEWQASKDGHLGELLKAMRMTFDRARKQAPCILFIDEIDGFGDRKKFNNRYSDYSIQVVNGLLEELDGVGGREGVVVIGASNNPERLDAAITRSGRLDRAILIPLPDEAGLALILRHHLGSDLPDADLTTAAGLALGGSGADCERYVRGARRRARQAAREMAIDDLIAEVRGPNYERSHADLHRAAIHESGHALVIHLDAPASLVRVSIRQTGMAGGRTSVRQEPAEMLTRADLHRRLRLLLAGRAAEEAALGIPSAGAGGPPGSDLAQATLMATAALSTLGLGDREAGGLLWQGIPPPEDIGTMLAMRSGLLTGVTAMLNEAYASCLRTMVTHMPILREIAQALMERETLEAAEVAAIVDGGLGGIAAAE